MQNGHATKASSADNDVGNLAWVVFPEDHILRGVYMYGGDPQIGWDRQEVMIVACEQRCDVRETQAGSAVYTLV